ncbi:MAG: phosphatase PAP2 family protein [Bacteroidota bacterium]
MKKVILQNLFFLIPYLFFLLISGYFLVLYPKGEIHLFINQFHNNFYNYFFYYATFLGEGFAIATIVLSLCFFCYRFALLVAVSSIFSSLIVQILKHTVYADVVRPKKFFEGIHELNFVPLVENYLYNSFPSGHTTVAFATFFCLSMILKNKFLKFLMFVIALTIGFSRVYLSQHFLNDIYAGSIIGITIALFVYYFFFLSKKLKNKKWIEKSLLNN